jgi:hypothetical protein
VILIAVVIVKSTVRLGLLQLAQQSIALGGNLGGRLLVFMLLVGEALLGLAGGMLGAAAEVVDLAGLLDDFGRGGVEVVVQAPLLLLQLQPLAAVRVGAGDRTMDVHLLDALEQPAHVDLGLWRGLLLGLGLAKWLLGGCSGIVVVRIGGGGEVVQVDHLVFVLVAVAVVEAVVGRVVHIELLLLLLLLLLGGADGRRLQLLQRVGGQVVEVGVGEVEFVIVHGCMLQVPVPAPGRPTSIPMLLLRWRRLRTLAVTVASRRLSRRL